MKKIFPNKTKFYRYSDFISYTREADQELAEILFSNIDTYYASEKNISENLKIELISIGQNQYLRIKVDGKFYYIDSTGVSKNEKGVLNITKLFDETNPITAKQSLPLEISYFGYSDNFGDYGREDFGIVYAYGSPQNIQNYSYAFLSNNKVSFWFEKVSFGAIYPLPERKGEISSALIQGLSFSQFKNDFCTENNKCKLKFKFLNLFTTQRPLVLEKISGPRKTYYLITKDLPIYNHGMYYEISEESPDEINLYVKTEEFLSNDVVKVYFLSEAFPQVILDDVSFNVYNFGFKPEHIHEDTPSNIKFFVEDGQGFLLDLDELGSAYGTNLYDLNLVNGTVKVNKVVLTGKNRLFFGNLMLKPEFPKSYNDYADNITVYVGHGIQKKIQSLPYREDLYIKNTTITDLVFTINSINGQKVNNLSTLDVKSVFSLGPLDETYEYLGTVEANLNEIYFEESEKFLAKEARNYLDIPTFGRHVFYLEKFDPSKLETAYEIAVNSKEAVKIFWIFLEWDDLDNKNIIKSIKQLQKALGSKEITLGIFLLTQKVSLNVFQNILSNTSKLKSLLRSIPAVYSLGPVDDSLTIISPSGQTTTVSLDTISNALLAVKDASVSNGKFFGVYIKNINLLDWASVLLKTEKDEEEHERVLFLRGGNILSHQINNIPTNIFLNYNLGDIKVYIIEDAFKYNQVCSQQNQDRLICRLFSNEQFYNFGLSTSFTADVPVDTRQFLNYLSILKNSFADFVFTVSKNDIPLPEKIVYTMLYNPQTKNTEIVFPKNRILKYKKLYYLGSQYTNDKFSYFASIPTLDSRLVNVQILNKENFSVSFDLKTTPFTINIYANGFAGILSTYTQLFSITLNQQQQKIVVQENNNTYLLDTVLNDYEHIEIKFLRLQNQLQITISTILSQQTFNLNTNLTTNSLLLKVDNNSNTESLRIGAFSVV